MDRLAGLADQSHPPRLRIGALAAIMGSLLRQSAMVARQRLKQARNSDDALDVGRARCGGWTDTDLLGNFA